MLNVGESDQARRVAPNVMYPCASRAVGRETLGLSLAEHAGEQKDKDRSAEPTAQKQIQQRVTSGCKHWYEEDHNCIFNCL